MLGELLGEEKGKVTTYRVMKSEGGHSVEVTFRTEGTVLGAQMSNIAPAVFCSAKGKRRYHRLRS